MSESEVKVGLNGTNGFRLPLLGFSKFTLPGVFGELAEQGIARAQAGCETIKVVSEELAATVHETYSRNAVSATDYGLKVIEISNANTASGIEFLGLLLGSKSMMDVFTLSAAQAHKAFDATSAQNKELWVLAQKLATETGEPIRRHVAKVLRQTD